MALPAPSWCGGRIEAQKIRPGRCAGPFCWRERHGRVARHHDRDRRAPGRPGSPAGPRPRCRRAGRLGPAGAVFSARRTHPRRVRPAVGAGRPGGGCRGAREPGAARCSAVPQHRPARHQHGPGRGAGAVAPGKAAGPLTGIRPLALVTPLRAAQGHPLHSSSGGWSPSACQDTSCAAPPWACSVQASR